jgi:hypothetical protein
VVHHQTVHGLRRRPSPGYQITPTSGLPADPCPPWPVDVGVVPCGQVSLSLTEEGERHWQEVAALVFFFLRLIGQAPQEDLQVSKQAGGPLRGGDLGS